MIALIGLPGNGKTYTINLLKEKGYSVLIADNFFKQQYKKGNEGYSLIKHGLGINFVSDKEVDISKLREYSINNMSKIEALVHPLLEKHLKINEYDFVEIPIINSRHADFSALFNLVINIQKKCNIVNVKRVNKDFDSMIINRQITNQKLNTRNILSGDITKIIKLKQEIK